MAQQLVLKVYANVIQPGKGLAEALRPLCGEAISTDDGDNTVTERDGMVLLSFEGIYFPWEDAAEIIGAHITPASSGKMDVLDMENWRITRFFIKDGTMTHRSGSLNNALDYNGF